MADINLDRMAVDDAAKTPERIADEIHRQLGSITGPVPVYDIARALDIEEIREEPLRRFEAMLLTEPTRNFGTVLLNSASDARRRRYSLAHELGHFLCPWHSQNDSNGFACSGRDMASPQGNDQHIRQEREANSFAIELLAPGRLMAPFLKRLPDLDVALAIHRQLEISKVAAARRYANLHSQALAVVIAKDGIFSYVERSPSFPFLRFESGEKLPDIPGSPAGGSTSQMLDADVVDWRLSNKGQQLFVQVLRQEEGHSLILLHLEEAE